MTQLSDAAQRSFTALLVKGGIPTRYILTADRLEDELSEPAKEYRSFFYSDIFKTIGNKKSGLGFKTDDSELAAFIVQSLVLYGVTTKILSRQVNVIWLTADGLMNQWMDRDEPKFTHDDLTEVTFLVVHVDMPLTEPVERRIAALQQTRENAGLPTALVLGSTVTKWGPVFDDLLTRLITL